MGRFLARVLALPHRRRVAHMTAPPRCPHTDKVPYSQAAAAAAVHSLEDTGRAGQEPLHAYPCEPSGHAHWHVGHSTRRKDKRAKGIRSRRATPRRRDSVRADREQWTHLNDALLNRSGGKCERCGRPLLTGGVPVSRHHRQRRRDGGDVLSNLMFLCGTGTTGCHGWITEHPAEAAAPANGWIVLTEFDPADVPVRLADGYLYRLDDRGGRRLVP